MRPRPEPPTDQPNDAGPEAEPREAGPFWDVEPDNRIINGTPSIDSTQVRSHPETNSFDIPRLLGKPGAAYPPGAIVRVTNLSNQMDPAESVVAEDGSFEVELLLFVGDEARVQLLDGDQRSEPVDIIADLPENPLQLAQRALDNCLLLHPPMQLDLATQPEVRVENTCSQTVRIDAPALRRPTPGLTISGTQSWPLDLLPNTSTLVPIGYQGSAPFEAVVFIATSAPAVDRRPITVYLAH